MATLSSSCLWGDRPRRHREPAGRRPGAPVGQHVLHWFQGPSEPNRAVRTGVYGEEGGTRTWCAGLSRIRRVFRSARVAGAGGAGRSRAWSSGSGPAVVFETATRAFPGGVPPSRCTIAMPAQGGQPGSQWQPWGRLATFKSVPRKRSVYVFRCWALSMRKGSFSGRPRAQARVATRRLTLPLAIGFDDEAPP